ncbi:tetratricopeptide repeat protein [Flavobacterium amniphilum]|uniref:tetratricopeptide repeat protein n=1 Tax=Flavobacterium amniphilum TaxID=1834035 RepID=UPI00202A6999|nr:tetratricopeptide repeat protein [Flavobacterium amniphilum]MCL9805797.1 tetratricopeptide repeat protein [Flavobacterium amniphilum]MCL9806384.1 tetratricopeptide repeat protein [Flavobacterium amniphilum]
MKLKIDSFVHFFILIVFVFLTVSVDGQNSERLDSVIKANAAKMYENPDAVIAAGKLVVNESESDVDIKIRGYKLISDGYSSKRDYKQSLKYVIKANELLPQSKDKLLKILIINKAGIQYHQLKVYDKSIQYLDEAEKLSMEYSSRDSVHSFLGVNYIVRGFIYKEKLNCDIAINYFDRGITELLLDKNLKTNASKISIAKYNKGNCYLLMSDTKSATTSFQESIDYAKETNAKSLLAFAQKGLAQVYTMEGKYRDAVKILEEALVVSKDVNDLVLNQEVFKGLSENYLALNDWKKYTKYRTAYLKTQRKLKEQERTSVSDSLLQKEQEEKKKMEDAIPQFWYAIIIVLMVSGFLIAAFMIYVRRSEAQIEKLHRTIQTLQNDKSGNEEV